MVLGLSEAQIYQIFVQSREIDLGTKIIAFLLTLNKFYLCLNKTKTVTFVNPNWVKGL